MRPTSLLAFLLVGTTLIGSLALDASPAHAAGKGGSSLVITNEPLPAELRKRVYDSPLRPVNIDPSQISGPSYYDTQSTAVQTEIAKIGSALKRIQMRMGELSGKSLSIKQENQALAAQYYASVATINTQLQTGTTPGNPRLVKRLNDAQMSLDRLGSNATSLNAVGVGLASLVAEANVLLQNARAAYKLTGAVEEDHLQLAQMEDQVSNNLVTLDRLQNGVADDITRTNAYLASEMANLRTISLAVTTGDYYSGSLGSASFGGAAGGMMPVSAPAAAYQQQNYMPPDVMPQAAPPPVSNYEVLPPAADMPPPRIAEPASYQRPATEDLVYDSTARQASSQLPPAAEPAPNGHILAKIKFDKPDVRFANPVYTAMNDALAKYPKARFDIIAVAPAATNPAEEAIANSKAQRNAEKVVKAMTEMGIPADRIALKGANSDAVSDSEVHILVR
jgi:hypothetical protein